MRPTHRPCRFAAVASEDACPALQDCTERSRCKTARPASQESSLRIGGLRWRIYTLRWQGYLTLACTIASMCMMQEAALYCKTVCAL